MKIYTKTGDKGMTSLMGGKRVRKDSQRVDSYGTVDELNSVLGVVSSFLTGKNEKVLHVKDEIERIQNDLFDIGSHLADPGADPLSFLPIRVATFEKIIDQMTSKLPPLRNFILPSGSHAGAHLHQSRTVTRRVERRLVALSQKEKVDISILIYFNRLSDLLFTMARYINHKDKQPETIWTKTTLR